MDEGANDADENKKKSVADAHSNNTVTYMDGVTVDAEDFAWTVQTLEPRRKLEAVHECWMQCENERCLKWRRVPAIVAQRVLRKQSIDSYVEEKDSVNCVNGDQTVSTGGADGRGGNEAQNNTRVKWTCEDGRDARFDSCDRAQELDDDAIDELMAEADRAAEEEE